MFELGDGSTLNAHLRVGKGVLLDFDLVESLQARAGSWRDQVAYVAQDCVERVGASALLVRPDGIVAWACDGVPDADGIARAAARWFGEPGGAPR